jgi:hypothetical protein
MRGALYSAYICALHVFFLPVHRYAAEMKGGHCGHVYIYWIPEVTHCWREIPPGKKINILKLSEHPNTCRKAKFLFWLWPWDPACQAKHSLWASTYKVYVFLWRDPPVHCRKTKDYKQIKVAVNRLCMMWEIHIECVSFALIKENM